MSKTSNFTIPRTYSTYLDDATQATVFAALDLRIFYLTYFKENRITISAVRDLAYTVRERVQFDVPKVHTYTAKTDRFGAITSDSLRKELLFRRHVSLDYQPAKWKTRSSLYVTRRRSFYSSRFLFRSRASYASPIERDRREDVLWRGREGVYTRAPSKEQKSRRVRGTAAKSSPETGFLKVGYLLQQRYAFLRWKRVLLAIDVQVTIVNGTRGNGTEAISMKKQ